MLRSLSTLLIAITLSACGQAEVATEEPAAATEGSTTAEAPAAAPTAPAESAPPAASESTQEGAVSDYPR